MNKIVFGIISITLFMVLSIGIASAFGFGIGKANLGNLSAEDKAILLEKRNATIAAIENNDYEAWKSIMSSEITQERFNQIVAQHKKMLEARNLRDQLREAIKNNDSAKVKEIKNQLSDLGFENGFNGKGMGRGMHGGDFNYGDGKHAGCPFAD